MICRSFISNIYRILQQLQNICSTHLLARSHGLGPPLRQVRENSQKGRKGKHIHKLVYENAPGELIMTWFYHNWTMVQLNDFDRLYEETNANAGLRSSESKPSEAIETDSSWVKNTLWRKRVDDEVVHT